ncbi:hypothetical protein [Nioella sp.]|jgi:hypothetical protein|uniref:hypothetical protein n=1 Tax=Nioella sp. TaxID=1912091 RepID=UPI003515BDCD
MRAALVLALCLSAPPIACADPVEPPPGSALRAELLDVLRRDVEPRFGGPVEFVVETLLVEDRRAVANLWAQRPGGAPIDLATSPLVTVEGTPPDLIDGPTVQAYLYRPGTYWQIVEYSIGATDAWWWGWDCRNYGAFFEEPLC